jgi:hypothetical protein
MRQRFSNLYWYHATRAVAMLLIFYGVVVEDDAGNRGTCITAAIGLLAAEPVGRREKAARVEEKKERRKDDDTG